MGNRAEYDVVIGESICVIGGDVIELIGSNVMW